MQPSILAHFQLTTYQLTTKSHHVYMDVSFSGAKAGKKSSMYLLLPAYTYISQLTFKRTENHLFRCYHCHYVHVCLSQKMCTCIPYKHVLKKSIVKMQSCNFHINVPKHTRCPNPTRSAAKAGTSNYGSTLG